MCKSVISRSTHFETVENNPSRENTYKISVLYSNSVIFPFFCVSWKTCHSSDVFAEQREMEGSHQGDNIVINSSKVFWTLAIQDPMICCWDCIWAFSVVKFIQYSLQQICCCKCMQNNNDSMTAVMCTEILLNPSLYRANISQLNVQLSNAR